MQIRGAIRLFAILMALASLYQLSFTWCTRHVESKAREYAKGDPRKEKAYLDSVSSEIVYNIGIAKFTYSDCKDKEINLGLDLKGGMNVTLEISVVDIIRSMAVNPNDPTLNKAIALAQKKQTITQATQKNFVTLFGEAFNEISPNGKLAALFTSREMKGKIEYNTPNDKVLEILQQETKDAFDNSFNIIKNRIDRFGVTQPNVQKLEGTDRILVELPGIKEPERVRKLLQGTAKLEFWETYENNEVYKYLLDANEKIKSLEKFAKTDTTATDSTTALLSTSDTTKKDTTKELSLIDQLEKAESKDTSKAPTTKEEFAKKYPLFAILTPSTYNDGTLTHGPVVGISHFKDTAKVNYYLRLLMQKGVFPRDMRFYWTVKSVDKGGNFIQLVAIKTGRDGRAPLEGDVITDARREFDQTRGSAEVTMTMNGEGARIWARLTKENIKRSIAIVLDDYVYSFPTVQTEITGGRSSITGNFSDEEARDLANVLKSGKMPAQAKIIEEAVVGPTLGKEAINAGIISMIVAFLFTLLYMMFYYNIAGIIADIALFTNMFFVFGILASIGAVLTLPGIAGIVLTIGMDVDKNVLIYERIREEIRAGKGMRLAINDGYKHALPSIIDSNITTLLTGIVLYIFGSGPVQGFATTLIIGIISSMFCAIFITQLIFLSMLDKNKNITVWTNLTKNILTNVNIDFIGLRKIFYIISGILFLIGIISLSFKGLNYGIDFLGGRTYVVRFDQDVRTDDILVSLEKEFKSKPEVKTFGHNNQVKITTSYLINDKTNKADSIVEAKLFDGIQKFYKSKISKEDFLSHENNKALGRLSSQKVEPTIASDMLRKAYYAVFFSLVVIFIYIAIRFKKWQWGMGGIVSLFHDTIIVISIFSIFSGILPFSLDIDQHFIAAILTIIGYSIMDSVIIFDRIREYQTLYPKRDMKENMNQAINSTLSRTLNTSGTTLMVLLAMFIFGGEVIRGFSFALIVGILIGTYSSVFNAATVAYDLIQWGEKRKAKKEQAIK